MEELHPRRDPSRNPLFQVMFALQNAPSTSSDLGSLNVTRVRMPRPSTRSISNCIFMKSQGLRGTFIYTTALFMPRLSRGSLNTSKATPCDRLEPGPATRRLPLLTEAERHKFSSVEHTQTNYPMNACLHSLFEAQVRMNPDALAISLGTSG